MVSMFVEYFLSVRYFRCLMSTNISITMVCVLLAVSLWDSCGFIQMWDLLHPHNGQECDQCSRLRGDHRPVIALQQADNLEPGHTHSREREQGIPYLWSHSVIFHLMTVYWLPNLCFICVYYFWLSQLFTDYFAPACYQTGWQMNVQIKSVWIKCFSRVLLVFIAFYNNTLGAKLFSKSYLAHI